MKEDKKHRKPTLLKLRKIVLDNWKKFFWGIVIFSVFSLCAGGWIFYNYKFPDNLWYCVGMTLQNCVETLLFNPVLTIQDIVEEKDFINSLHGYKYAFTVMYKIAMVAVPLIEVLAIFSILNYFLRLFVGWTPEEKKILIVGYNDRVRKLLDRGGYDAKIYLWTDKLLSEEEKKALFLKNIMTETEKFQISSNPKKGEKTIEKFNGFLKDNDITNVLLLDESDFRNMEYYMALSSCDVCKGKTIHFFVQNKDFEMRNMLQDYFDSKLLKITKPEDENEPKDTPTKDTHMDLRIFNFEQIQAEKIFSELPLFFDENTQNKPHNRVNMSNNVHLLIVGEREICEQILLHAMNQGVITPENDILIDIINEDTAFIEKRLKDRFNLEYVDLKDGVFRISSPDSDGNLVVRLTHCSFNDESFADKIVEKASPDKYTYFVFCLPSPEMNLHCMLQMKKYKESISEEKISVVARITDTKENKEFLNSFILDPGDRVYLMGKDGEKIGIHQIIDADEEERIRDYHANYTVVSKKLDGEVACSDPEILWNWEEYYKRESNRALFFHQKNKDYYKKCLTNKEAYDKEVENFINNTDIGSLNAPECSKRLLAKDNNGNVNFPILLEMAKTEHRRFNYFLASRGWGYNIKVGKIKEKKLHGCLREWDELVKKCPDVLIYDLVSNDELFPKKKQQCK